MSAAVVAAGASALALAGALNVLLGSTVSLDRLPQGVAHAAGQWRGMPGWSPGVARPLLMAVVAGCIAVLLVSLPQALMAAAAAGAASVGLARRAEHATVRATEEAAPSLARSLADALRGGASVRGALRAAADDRSIPAAARQRLQQQTAALELGASVGEVLTAIAGSGGPSSRLLCGTVAMHLDAGGALARELDRLAADAEAAQRVDHERAAATAQARATVRVVAALPLLAMGGAQVANHDFFSTLAAKPLALALLLLGLLLEAAAILVARAIVGRT